METHNAHKTGFWIIAMLMVLGVGLVTVNSSAGEYWSPVTQSSDILLAQDGAEEEDWSGGLRLQGILLANDASEEEEEEDWTLG